MPACSDPAARFLMFSVVIKFPLGNICPHKYIRTNNFEVVCFLSLHGFYWNLNFNYEKPEKMVKFCSGGRTFIRRSYK